jgi:zinc transporter
VLSAEAGARELDWHGVRTWRPEQGWLWLHLDRTDVSARSWLESEAGLDPVTVGALLEEETRPRLVPVDGERMLVILRGVNLNPGAEPDDMIALRALFGADRVITLRQRRLLVVQDVRDAIAAGRGPRTPGELLVQIAGGLVDRQVPVVDHLEDVVDDVEERLLDGQSRDMRSRIAEFRRQVIGLRRYLAPQRDVLARTPHENLPWLSTEQRARLREIADRQMRLVEDLDAARDRAAIAQEELAGRLSEQMNRNTYLLSIVAAIFLPLGLLTGLLGINVGGIPLAESSFGFAIVSGILTVLAITMVLVLRMLRLL